MTSYYRFFLLAGLVGWMMPAPTQAQEQITSRPVAPSAATGAQQRSIRDVVLQDGGVLRGRFVDDGGVPIDGARLVVRQNDRIVAVIVTNSRGEFSAEGLSAGVFRIESPTVTRDYRLWQSADAPPSARPVALVVSETPTLRGQYRYRNLDLLTLGLGAGGVTLGVLALDKADDAESRANRLQRAMDELSLVSP